MKVSGILMILLTLAGSFQALAQNRAINGRVVDSAGEPIIGAGVVVPGTTTGVTTDLDGNFQIRVATNTMLEISCIGYSTIRVAAMDNMVVTLADDTEMLEETVVIGYGVQKKSDLTGAVGSVRGEDLQKQSTTDAAAALQGKVAGVSIITNGAPGEAADIRVRGYSSNGGNISPLLIVDGLQVNSIQYLDPTMIESIEVLKDAASAAIYGAQAGNGVVLITTKQGQDGHTSVSYSGKASLQMLNKRPMMNREQFIKYKGYEVGEETMAAKLKDYDYSHPDYPNGVIDTDWISAFTEPTWSHQHSLSFSGGNKSGHFFTSLNYVKNDGIVKGDKDSYTRISAQVNADYQIFKWLQVGTNNSFEKFETKSVTQRGFDTSFDAMLRMDPLTPVYWLTPDEMETNVRNMYNQALAGGTQYFFPRDEHGWFANTKYRVAAGSPLGMRDITEGSSSGTNLNGTLFANITPIKGLTITSRFGYRIGQSNTHSYQPPFYMSSRSGTGSTSNYTLSATTGASFYYQWENFANYNKTFGKHTITAMAGMSYRQNTTDNTTATATGADILPGYDPQFRYIDFVKGDASKTFSNLPTKTASLAYFGRLIYSYDNRYSVQANFRADAFDSSKLPKNSRWGYFPSFSAGWTVSNESFFKDNIDRDVFSFLKIRASWGRNGNVNVLRNYPYATTISLGNNFYQYHVDQIGSEFSSAPSGLANPNLTWETSEQVDLGLDARFFNSRLTLGVDYFNKTTKDLLFNVTVPPELGVTSTTIKGGNVLNKGLELELSWKDHIGDFNYSVSANFSALHNEVLSLPEGTARITGGGAGSSSYPVVAAFEPGYPVWYLRGYIYDGIAEDGSYILRDVDKDGVVTNNDMTYIGSGTPTSTFGLNINLEYKGFDFALYGAGAAGSSILPISWHSSVYSNMYSHYLTRVRTPENPNGDYPHPSKIRDERFWSSTANIFKGDFFRIKQLQLGYTLPSKLSKKAAISNLRFYVSLDDFFTFTKYIGLDPETATTGSSGSGTGFDTGAYPVMQKVILGVNLTF